jgi:hypothetical protein
MTSEHGMTTDMVAADAARVSLDHLMGWVGVDGLVAALGSPGVLAVVDQHAAAVRDALGTRVGEPRALAEYAREVHVAALRDVHPLPDPARLDWSTAPAYLLRLVAVCALAGVADCL